MNVGNVKGVLRNSLLALMVFWLSINTANADSPTCKDSGFFTQGKMITDFCWECIFPMKIVGVTIPIGKRSANKLPSSTASPVCVCPGRFGIPSIGVSLGYWSPDHAIEIVKEPFCLPMLGMTLFSFDDAEFKGIMAKFQQGAGSGSYGRGQGSETANASGNLHWIQIPSGYFTDAVTSSVCSGGGSADFDFGYLTEIDPTWHSDALALYTHPEARVFTKMYAMAVCMADAVATNIRKPIATANWCLGSWGQLYPYTGRGSNKGSVIDQATFAAKGIAAMHRRGLTSLKYGNSAICKDRKYFLFPKQQYQFQNFWPKPINDAVWIGTGEPKWGMNRQDPRTGDRMFIEFGYQECCITAW